MNLAARSSAAGIAAVTVLVSGTCGDRNAFAQPPAVPLDAQPAKLAVEGASGATVHVDGKHLQLEAGKTATISVDLEATRQRKASWVLLGTSGAAIAGGIVLGVLSVVEQRKAREIHPGGDLNEQLQRTRAALSARDDYRLGSGIAAGTGLGLFLVGGALLVIDGSSAASPPGAEARASALPVVGPGFAGAIITLRF